MSKSEKRYFRLNTDIQKGEKAYIALFDVLESCHEVSSLHAAVARAFPNTRVEPARKHLYKVLMKSLRQYTREDIDVKLMNLLQDSRILYNRGLVKMSFDQLAKGKQLALVHEKFMYYALLAKQELHSLERLQFAGTSEAALIEKQEMLGRMLEQESKISKHAMLFEVLLLRYRKNGVARSAKDITVLNDLLLEEYQLLKDARYKSFHADQLHLHFQSTYFQMTGDPQGSLDVFHELNSLFQKNRHLWKDTPLYYLQLLEGILYDLRWMGKYDDMDFFLGELNTLAELSEELHLVVKYKTVEYDLLRKVDQGLFADAWRVLEHHKAMIAKEAHQLPFYMELALQLAMVRTYMTHGHYSPALKIINKILNLPPDAVNPSLHTLFQLLNLLVNALMDDVTYLSHALRAVERKLKSERKLFETEQLILSTLKKWVAHKPVAALEAGLVTLAENPYEHQLIRELCLKFWFGKMKFQKDVGARRYAVVKK
ncbi:hypothetical protein [Chryseolinea lacunae]|uniref:Tetratricopeptide repeat protein n=1 Tax=Chryseolinea lacunae TaxID=2801331 RepID=A0ABS1KMK9_9BACT|nr:hypothetical protein [Chryseolinea lacunae]MBL0740477.1 hypothetical protein [Chryseolinea lacunae]